VSYTLTLSNATDAGWLGLVIGMQTAQVSMNDMAGHPSVSTSRSTSYRRSGVKADLGAFTPSGVVGVVGRSSIAR
jgi:hypothetical protein